MNLGNTTVDYFEILVASIIAEVLLSVFRDRNSKAKNKVLGILINECCYIGVYIIFYFLVIFVYSLVRSEFLKAPFLPMFKTLLVYLIMKNGWAMIIVPGIVEFLTNIIDRINEDKSRNRMGNAIKLGIAFAGLVFLITKPLYSNYATDTDKSNQKLEFVYCTKFYCPEHFKKLALNGYVEPEAEPQSQSNSGYDWDEYAETLIEKEISELSFGDLITVVAYYYRYEAENSDYEINARKYLKKAYKLYNKSKEACPEGEVARMWWYKGYYDSDGQCYINAGQIYEELKEYYNAAVSYYPAYRNYKYCESDKVLGNYFRAIKENKDESIINIALSALLYTFSCDKGTKTPYLKEFSELLPDDMRVQILRISSHIVANNLTKEDMSFIERSLKRAKYKDCPKLLLARAYYSKINWDSVDMNLGEIYDLYLSNEDYFEPEDRINLSWMLIDCGETEKAGEVISGLSYPEASVVRAALMIKSETEDQSLETEYEIIKGYRSDFLNHYGSEWTLKYDINLAIISSEIDDTGSTVDEATRTLNSKKYVECIDMCNSVLEKDPDNMKIRFIKAEAYIRKAEENDDENDRKTDYVLAESTLKSIGNKYEDDYLESLRRLDELYKKMPEREVELREIDTILKAYD